jgi:hypothetical protein
VTSSFPDPVEEFARCAGSFCELIDSWFGLQNGWGTDAVRALTAIHWLTHASGARSVAPGDP